MFPAAGTAIYCRADYSRLSIFFAAVRAQKAFLVNWYQWSRCGRLFFVEGVDSNVKCCAHYELVGGDERSFFFGVSSGVGGLQVELAFFFALKRGDVESLQSPDAH